MQEKTVETKYALEAPTYRCAGCAGETAPGSAYLSAILFEGEVFQRREFCAPCWDQGRFSAEEAFAYWRTRRPLPPAPPPRRRRFDVDLIWTFFERLKKDLDAAEPVETAMTTESTGPAVPEAPADPADPAPPDAAAAAAAAAPPAPEPAPEPARMPAAEKTRLCFLLALLLVRSKRLVLEATAIRGGREWLRLSRKGEPETAYLVENPDLGASDLEQAKDALGGLLEMEL